MVLFIFDQQIPISTCWRPPVQPFTSPLRGPQGSILGQLLFVIYINGLPLSSHLSNPLYASDTKSFNNIKQTNQYLPIFSRTTSTLIGSWGNLWRMTFSESKCVHVRFLPTLGPSPSTTYHINQTTILLRPLFKDLGVILTSDLSFSQHHHLIVSKAYKISVPSEGHLKPNLPKQKGNFSFH